ncbi:Ion transport protein [Saprospira grandis DSM 2844]|uniref:Ion transport protein n=1 Tax=Saprospira grandis DSM 2844 TaxID=694433 RepID=J1I3V3_9BACT|nr:ion transporter [Saprospira grandis]EJF53420.1 Ion transport protein [Saprospira grandis DSM 2844]
MSSSSKGLQEFARSIIRTNLFNFSILGAIVINGLLIGIQTYEWAPEWLHYVQLFILFVFFGEIWLRWVGRTSTKQFLSDGWNYFDIIILVLGVVPEVADIIMASEKSGQNSVWATLRVLRVVQLTRSIRAVEEMQVLVAVLVRSVRSLSYIAVLFFLIMYIYAIIGVSLFKNPDYAESDHLALTISNPDPYKDMGEAFFTLFRILTGEDWTDLRYNMLDNEYTTANGRSVVAPDVPNWVKTLYHVSWMIIAAYLLMNLVVGAIVNNFQMVLDAKKEKEEGGNGGNGGDKPKRTRISKRPKV